MPSKGTYLRTNYRQTGGVQDITAIGAPLPLSSAAGGAGTDTTGGGFLWFSMAMTTGDDTVNLATGQSAAFYDSTYGTMSLYYGCTVFNSGYKFLPVGFYPLSLCECAIANFNKSMPLWLKLHALAASGSVWRMTFGIMENDVSAGGASHVFPVGSWSYACTCGIRLLIYGFIVSAP